MSIPSNSSPSPTTRFRYEPLNDDDKCPTDQSVELSLESKGAARADLEALWRQEGFVVAHRVQDQAMSPAAGAAGAAGEPEVPESRPSGPEVPQASAAALDLANEAAEARNAEARAHRTAARLSRAATQIMVGSVCFSAGTVFPGLKHMDPRQPNQLPLRLVEVGLIGGFVGMWVGRVVRCFAGLAQRRAENATNAAVAAATAAATAAEAAARARPAEAAPAGGAPVIHEQEPADGAT